MQNRNDIHKRANRHFYIKIAINTLLVIIGAVFISVLLQRMQYQTTLSKQRENSELALTEVVSSLDENDRNTRAMQDLFHDGNQDMLDDLEDLLSRVGTGPLSAPDSQYHGMIFQDLAELSDLDYLFLLGSDGRIAASHTPENEQKTLPETGLMSQESFDRLSAGTRLPDGQVSPVAEGDAEHRIYFYSIRGQLDQEEYILVLGVNADDQDKSIETLGGVDQILARATVGNDGFMFAVNADDGSFLYYKDGKDELTGKNAFEAGLSQKALQDGYSGVETINGKRYFCVSKLLENGTVVCAATDTDIVFANDKHVLSWTIAIFLLVMALCLIYTVIVRNDYIRNAVETKKKVFYLWIGSPVIFDITIFQKVFPLMITGVLVIFGISFYSQTLLEISQTARKASVALEEASERYDDGIQRRETIQKDHDSRYLAKARIIAYMLEEDPSVLNEPTDREYSSFNEDGVREYNLDSQGNRLRSVSGSSRLQKLCEINDLDSIYVFDDNGHTIATNTANWFFTLSHDPADQSQPFLQVLEGKKDELIQGYQVSDTGSSAQYIGVAFRYYTALDDEGRTVYLSRRDYEAQKTGSDPRPITAHRSLLQIGLDSELGIVTATKTEYILSSNILDEGAFLLFDNTENHVCVYSPYEENIGVKAAEMGISEKAFTPGEYYGFPRVNGAVHFLYSRYRDGDYIVTIIPRSDMYQARTRIALNTALISLLLILFLSETVALTTEEEEMLYTTMSDNNETHGMDAILNMFLPFHSRTSVTEPGSRWNNMWIPWWHKTPEQKLTRLIGAVGLVLLIYLVITITGAKTFFQEHSVILYILSGGWDRGLNIFALSACVLAIIVINIGISLLRIPLRSVTSLLGTHSETIGNLMLSVVKYGGAIGAIFYCLYMLGMDTASLLASAGVLSLVIGLGAQSLIKDILAGIFFVFDGEFRMGDIVTIGDYRGTVMDIGLRTTKVLGPGGNIKIFNNSEISGVLNMTQESSFTYCRISIEYGQDIDYVEAVLRRDLPKLKEKNPQLLSEPVCLGVQTLGDSGIDLLIQAESKEQDIKSIARFMNKELLNIFYRNGIQIPFPNVTVSTLDMSGRKTMADFKDIDEDVSSWWDSVHRRTKMLTISNLGDGMENALHTTEQVAAMRGLSRHAGLQLRLLAEELFGLLRGIAGDATAYYWIAVAERLYELHMRMQMHMTSELREQLLGVSTSGKNAAVKGFVSRLQDVIYVKLLSISDDLSSEGANGENPVPGTASSEEWSMSQFKSDIDGSSDAAELYDELEKSILARLADDVKVSMRGSNVEITVSKTFPKDKEAQPKA